MSSRTLACEWALICGVLDVGATMAAGGGGEELGGGRWESAVTQPIRGLARATSTLTPLSLTRVPISHPLIQPSKVRVRRFVRLIMGTEKSP